MTVLEAIQRSTEFLAGKGVDSPRLQTELLLSHVLRMPRMRLYLDFERVLVQPEVEALRQIIKRRGQREPLQHIVGVTSFCGLDIAVNRHVLVPRPETEILAERAWKFLQQSEVGTRSTVSQLSPAENGDAMERVAINSQAPLMALDWGTGSGCLAITLAVKCPQSRIIALEISREALDQAAQNAQRIGVVDRIEWLHGDGLSALPPKTRFDLIVANPPYIPTAEIPNLDPEVRDHDPRCALDGGPDGLDCFRRLATEAPSFLTDKGRLMVEFGDGQAERLQEIFVGQKWIVEAVEPDYTQRPRILIAALGS